jgi:large subunit ribosomal protein L21
MDETYAIFQIGSHQYRAVPGMRLRVQRLRGREAGEEVRFDRVLAMRTSGGVRVGSPTVPNAAVVAKVLEHGRDKKVIAYKFIRRSGYHRKKGHRQPYTLLEITGIEG